MKLNRALLLLVLALGVGGAGVVRAQTVWNLASGFSTSTATPGAWSYGWVPSLGGTFTVYDTFLTSSGVQIWRTSSEVPALLYNPTGSQITVGSALYPATTIVQHPADGSSGAIAVARWTAPATGIYSISATFASSDTFGATTGASVRQNNTTLGSGNVSSGASFSYSVSTLSVTMGDLIDFSVSNGTNQTFNNDSTTTVVVITAVPEPASVAGLLGVATLSAVAWYRRRSA